jgi:hypothetical protein
MSCVISEPLIGPAESETLSMRGHSMYETRETTATPAGRCTAGRSGKTCGQEPDMHVSEESDIGIVPEKEPNKRRVPTAGGGSGGKAGDQGEF